jgi:hypothetical protein
MSCLSGTSGACLSIAAESSHRSITGIRDSERLPGLGRRKLFRITTALGLWTLTLGPAYASLVYDTSIVSFSDSVSVTDAEGGASSTSNNNASLGSSALEQFDASLGVLTGVTVNLDSTRTQSVTVSSTASGSGNNPVTSTGTGSSTAAISAPGVSYTFTTAITANGSCSGRRRDACSNTTTAAGVSTIQDQAATGSLDSYVGGGTVNVSRTAPTLSASQGTGVFNGAETTQYNLAWAGDLSATYSYLLHAAPSFNNSASVDSLTLDFGTVEQYSSVGQLGFSIFNLADPNRTDLDLVSFTATGDTIALGSALTPFANLLQGSDQLFYATLDTTNLGVFSATYVLTLSDAANIGAASSHHTYTLYLTLTGTVVAPLPDSVWLFGTGLIGIAGIARRKTP